MGRMDLELSFYCENRHHNRDQAAWFELFVDDGDIKRLKDFHLWVNEKNFSHMFKKFTYCPECGKPYEKFEITKREIERSKANYECSFIHGENRCILSLDYEVDDYTKVSSFYEMIEELLPSKIEELFSTFEHCPYCAKTCKGIVDIAERGDYPYAVYKIKH